VAEWSRYTDSQTGVYLTAPSLARSLAMAHPPPHHKDAAKVAVQVVDGGELVGGSFMTCTDLLQLIISLHCRGFYYRWRPFPVIS
jgi:hypothetical protein